MFPTVAIRLAQHPSRATRALPSIAQQYAPATPHLRQRPHRLAAPTGPDMQRAPYYFDASRQTAKTLTTLLEKLVDQRYDTRQPSATTLLGNAMHALLHSLPAQQPDEITSRQIYQALLRAHLNTLDAPMLEKLKQTLEQSGFECLVTESVIDDPDYEEFGFANGPPRRNVRTLIQTPELLALLSQLQARREASLADIPTYGAPMPLPANWAQATRDVLAHSAREWAQRSPALSPMPVLMDAAKQFAAALDHPFQVHLIQCLPLAHTHSTMTAIGANLFVDSALASTLSFRNGPGLFASALRDLLELSLLKKMFGDDAQLALLTPPERRALQKNLTQVIDHVAPGPTDPTLCTLAQTVLEQEAHFGKVLIIPPSGAALGHAWIAPHLSLVPDRRGPQQAPIGKRFMQTGFHTDPEPVPVREWPALLLNEQESEQRYPAAQALQVTVPVEARRLQEAALHVADTWRRNNVPYRFIGTAPDMEATGCRVTVWQAVQQGMSEDMLTLFKHFNSGLPDPESPIELCLRLDSMMAWLHDLASGPQSGQQ